MEDANYLSRIEEYDYLSQFLSSESAKVLDQILSLNPSESSERINDWLSENPEFEELFESMIKTLQMEPTQEEADAFENGRIPESSIYTMTLNQLKEYRKHIVPVINLLPKDYKLRFYADRNFNKGLLIDNLIGEEEQIDTESEARSLNNFYEIKKFLKDKLIALIDTKWKDEPELLAIVTEVLNEIDENDPMVQKISKSINILNFKFDESDIENFLNQFSNENKVFLSSQLDNPKILRDFIRGYILQFLISGLRIRQAAA